LQAAPRLTFRESLRCARLALWDPERRKLVPFRAANGDPPVE
jgi:omega-6 fatty acid desaturase (delta-12 desaturase)